MNRTKKKECMHVFEDKCMANNEDNQGRDV